MKVYHKILKNKKNVTFDNDIFIKEIGPTGHFETDEITAKALKKLFPEKILLPNEDGYVDAKKSTVEKKEGILIVTKLEMEIEDLKKQIEDLKSKNKELTKSSIEPETPTANEEAAPPKTSKKKQ